MLVTACLSFLSLPLDLPQAPPGARTVPAARVLAEPGLGAHPLDALTPGWPYEHLVLAVDLDEEHECAALEKAVVKLAGSDPRLRIVVVDRSDRDRDALGERLWELGFHDLPACVTTELADGEPAESGWRLQPAWPDFGDIGVAVPEAPEALTGGLGRASAIVRAVEESLEGRSSGLEYLLSRTNYELVLELDHARLAKLLAPYEDDEHLDGTQAGERASLVLAIGALDEALPHLVAELELAWARGRPLDAAARLDALREAYGEAPALAQALGRLQFLDRGEIPRRALKADQRLRRVLGKERPRNPERTLAKLEALVADEELPDAVRERAGRYLALVQ